MNYVIIQKRFWENIRRVDKLSKKYRRNLQENCWNIKEKFLKTINVILNKYGFVNFFKIISMTHQDNSEKF